jgi:quercetin dioxygenase-like cupin family protein
MRQFALRYLNVFRRFAGLETINIGGIMNKRIALFVFIATMVLCVHAQDPAVTDGDKYKVVLENEKVRVFEYMDKPGEKTHRHHHPDFILYALDSFKRKLTFGDGKQIEREFKKGEVMWMKDQIHIGENIGTTETHVLIVELKTSANDIHDTTVKAVPYDEKWNEKGEKKPKGK